MKTTKKEIAAHVNTRPSSVHVIGFYMIHHMPSPKYPHPVDEERILVRVNDVVHPPTYYLISRFGYGPLRTEAEEGPLMLGLVRGLWTQKIEAID